jgi:hypothetical protein
MSTWPLFVQFWIPFTQKCFVPRLIEIGLLILEKKIIFFKFNEVLLLLLSSLRKWPVLHLNNSEFPLAKDNLCQFSLEFAQRFCRRSRKCKTLNRQTDDGQQAIRKAHLSFQLRWANKRNTKVMWETKTWTPGNTKQTLSASGVLASRCVI